MRIASLKVGLLPSGPRPSSEATEGSDLTQAFRFEIFEGFLLAIQECLTAGARRCGKSTRNVISLLKPRTSTGRARRPGCYWAVSAEHCPWLGLLLADSLNIDDQAVPGGRSVCGSGDVPFQKPNEIAGSVRFLRRANILLPSVRALAWPGTACDKVWPSNGPDGWLFSCARYLWRCRF
jgi:hypothetical protein